VEMIKVLFFTLVRYSLSMIKPILLITGY